MPNTPKLTLSEEALSDLREHSTAVFEELGQRFSIESANSGASDSPAAFAAKLAGSLKHAMLSSDTDAPYWSCTIHDLGDDPWHATGIKKSERVKMSGWDAPKLEARTVTALQALTNLGDDDFEEVEEYYEVEDFEEAVALLDKADGLLNLRLANTVESTYFVCVLAKIDGAWAGVASISVQT